MSELSREDGYIGPQFLFVLLFLATIAYGAGFLVSTVMRGELASIEHTKQLADTQEIEMNVLQALRDDPSPNADTPNDPVWDLQNTQHNGYTIHIRSLSGSVNVNFIRKDIIDKTDLKSLFINGKTSNELQQHRYDNHLSIHPSEYEGFFDPKAFETYLTCYGWGNINLIEEFALERYVESLTGSTSRGESYHAKFQQSLLDKKTFTNESLRLFFGLDYQDIYPYLNVEPSLNVNFAHQFILREIIKYPPYDIENPDTRATNLLQERVKGIESTRSIATILGVPENHPLCNWLGCVTWFWEIVLDGPKKDYRFVICRIPDNTMETEFKPLFRVIERGFTP